MVSGSDSRLILISLVGLTCLAGCFETRVIGSVRTTGSFVGTTEVRVTNKLNNEPAFAASLDGQRTIPDYWQSKGVAMSPDGERDHIFSTSADSIAHLNLPWHRHEFIAGNGTFSYVGDLTLPTTAVTLIQGHIGGAIDSTGRFGPKAALATAQLIKTTIAHAGVVVELTFPGPVTFTNGTLKEDLRTVYWKWSLEDLQRRGRQLAIAAGSYSWYREFLDAVMDATGL